MADRFILSYEIQPPVIEQKLIAYVDNLKGVVDWTHPYEGIFIFCSEDHLNEISERFYQFFSGSPFLVVKMTGVEVFGSQAESTWSWLRKYGAKLTSDKDA